MPQIIQPTVPPDDPSLLTFPAAVLLAEALPFQRLSLILRLHLTNAHGGRPPPVCHRLSTATGLFVGTAARCGL